MVELVKQDFVKNQQLYKKVKEKLVNTLGKDYQINHVESTDVPII
ncbi:MAG: hypothetical protein PHE54_04120 [Bacilli bacterium]|nr:hypothetical protein [Bacilli bacterium]